MLKNNLILRVYEEKERTKCSFARLLKMLRLFSVLTTFLWALNHVVYAQTFRNSYISFELPRSDWKCNLDQTEWVCYSERNNRDKDAIMIFTAKKVGPTDSYKEYENFLKTPKKTAFRPKGSEAPEISKIITTPMLKKINDQEWLDSLHLHSEVSNYYTRYLAAIKDNIAIVVTLSAHEKSYPEYTQDFFKTIQSLRVIVTADLLNNPSLGPLRPEGSTLSGGFANPWQRAMELESGEISDMGDTGNKKKEAQDPLFWVLIAGVLALIGVYFIFLKKK